MSKSRYNIQGPSDHAKLNTRYDELVDEIHRKTGIICRVFVQPELITIRAASYADYVLAKAAIKGSVTKEIVFEQGKIN